MNAQRMLGIGIASAALACSAALLLTRTAAAGPAPLVLYVDDDMGPGGDGSAASPFRNIPEAVASARTQVSPSRGITIRVAPGSYPIDGTLRLDFPVQLIGSNVQDTIDGWPAGTAQPGTETWIVATTCVIDDDVAWPLVLIGSAADDVVDGVSVENFSLLGIDSNCPVVQAQHARELSIVGNIVLGPGLAGIDAAASSGNIVANFVSGMQSCGICIAAGTLGSPANVTAADNRSVGNRVGGLLLSGSPYPVAGSGNGLVATVRHNDLSHNRQGALGFGLRVLLIGPDAADTSRVRGRVVAEINDNRIADNVSGFVVDAGFPTRVAQSGDCDERLFTGTLDLTLGGNDVQLSSISKRLALVSYTRAQVVVRPQTNPLSNWQYLHEAEITIADPDLSLGDFDPDHPLLDPYPAAGDPYIPGACDADLTNEALGNRLLYNGVEVLPTY